MISAMIFLSISPQDIGILKERDSKSLIPGEIDDDHIGFEPNILQNHENKQQKLDSNSKYLSYSCIGKMESVNELMKGIKFEDSRF